MCYNKIFIPCVYCGAYIQLTPFLSEKEYSLDSLLMKYFHCSVGLNCGQAEVMLKLQCDTFSRWSLGKERS